MSSSSSSSFFSIVPQHCSNVPMLFELLRGEEEHCRVWLRAEMNQIPDPLIDSLFHGLIMSSSSSSSAGPQHRSTVFELRQQLQGEKVQVMRVLKGEMDRLVNSLFERLTDKLVANTDLDRSEDGSDRAQVDNLLDRVESPNGQSHQPSTSSFNLDSHFVKQEIKEEFEDGEMLEIKEEEEDGETRLIDIEELTHDNQGGDGESGSEENARTVTTQQMDYYEPEVKGEFDYGHEIEITQEDESETNNGEIMEIREEEEEDEDGVDDTRIIDEVETEDKQGDDDESRSVENASMDTTSSHPTGVQCPVTGHQSQVNIKQSGRIEKRKNDDELQVPNEVNNRDNRQDIEEDEDNGDDVDDGGEVTSQAVKRPRPSRPTIPSTTQEKQIITLTLRCPQLACGEIAKDEFNVHMWNRHSIGAFRCALKDCGQSYENTTILGDHLAQAHQHTVPWHCDKCAKHFSTYALLSNHTINYHQLGHFQCFFPSCTFTGEYKRKVYSHYAQQHRDKPEFVCAVSGCDYRTKNSAQFKTHQRSHLGTKPYQCKWPNCHYCGASQDAAMKHIKRSHFKTSSSLNLTRLGEPKDYLEFVP